jgi:hypothetical protein
MINSTLVKKLEPEYSIDKYGYKRSFNSEGQLHSFYDQPALIYTNGIMVWYKDGKEHRDNGLPAVTDADGHKEWWVNGVCIRKEWL